MKVSFNRPNQEAIAAFLKDQSGLLLSYNEQGFATETSFPSGYDHDRNEVFVGIGEEVFSKAKQQIQQYNHFPEKWAFLAAEKEPEVGLNVAVFFYQLGLWWWNGSRIIAVIDRANFYGFSYGTLSNHIERGEELFYTRQDEKGNVFYGIQAYSQPRFWGVRLLKFYARKQQFRFVQDSMKRMRKLCANG